MRMAAVIVSVLTCAVAGSAAGSELDVARQALRDGLWDFAKSHAEAAMEEDPAVVDEARLVILEAMSAAGEVAGVPARISAWGDPQGEGFRYWRAWALERQGAASAARAALNEVAFTNTVYVKLAERLQARIAVALDDRADAEARFKALGAGSKGESKTENAMEWARALVRFKDDAAAVAVLKSEGALAASGAAGDEARLLAATIASRAGDKVTARSLWTRLVSPPGEAETTQGAYVAAATELSRTLFMEGATNEAVRLARAAFARAARPDLRRMAGACLGFELIASPSNRAEGVAIVKEQVRADPAALDAREIQLRLADELSNLGDPSAADEYNVFLEAYPEASHDPRVLEGRGWALFKLGKRTEAIGMFERAAKASSNDVDRARCEFKQADALREDGKDEEAALLYARVAERYDGGALADTARFNCARALDRCGKSAEAAEIYRRLGEGTGRFAHDAALSLAAYVADHGRIDEALSIYSRLIADGADKDEHVLNARIGRGRTYYRDCRFAEAKKDFAAVAAADATRLDSMRFLTALCAYGSGRDAEAKKIAASVLADMPGSSLAPDISLWLAKLDYQKKAYAAAADGFEHYAKGWPDAPHAIEAHVWAARAACAIGDFGRAVEDSSAAVKAGAAGGVLSACLLVQAEALMELARFDEAALVLERVTPEESVAADAVRAAMLRADCLFALGADNEQRYEEALNAYRGIAMQAGVSSGERLAVAFKIGRVLEKTGRVKEAMDQYYANVVCAFRDAKKDGVWFDDRGCTFFARAGFALADHYVGCGEEARARSVLELVASAGVPASEEARKRIERLGGKRSLL